ncbi:hypothetical protein ATN84_10370 [Paramesorhizobium deserti]|uniref:SH3b domain-containing protein n=1 Tax=Paramesorhizobium deserti TaxID=1494590 RepID=A0A135HX06_9HYPH|nr:hypothetical protein [Paramesorhizobium deserti]KXF77726.1 hypothetical protein ATN84_10370 [Paramesorhizobium deserti]
MARKRRSSKRSSFSGSGIALAVIVAMGAAGWWAAYQDKNPKTDFSRIFSQLLPQRETSPKVSRPKETVANKAPANREQPKTAAAKADIPRPPVPVRPAPAPSRSTTTQMAAVKPPASLVKPDEAKSAVKNIPVGRAAPNTTPSVIYARERITIREHAWEKAAAVGTVEKGREMRSYGKTGKWHRVVVPSTTMIGWVHEDRLAASQPRSFITGSILRNPIRPDISAPALPPMPVGNK